MSDREDNNPDVGIVDEENYVDRRAKDRILNNRQKIDDWGEKLFTGVRMGEMDEETALNIWRDRIVDYLVSIEPLLRDFSLPESRQAYIEEQLAVIQIEPPEKYQQPASRPSMEEVRNREFEFYGCDPPEPKTKTLVGLKDIIELEAVSAEWEFRILKKREPLPEVVQIQEVKPIPRPALRNAVRVADEFLQNAGVGMEMGADEHTSETAGI